MKCIFAVLVMVASFLSLPIASADPEPEPEASPEVWVAIDATTKGLGTQAVEYYGAIDRKVFEEALTRSMPGGFVKLTHTAWMDGGQIKRLADSTQESTPRGYTDVMYFRIETVTRMVELDDSFVRQYLLQTK